MYSLRSFPSPRFSIDVVRRRRRLWDMRSVRIFEIRMCCKTNQRVLNYRDRGIHEEPARRVKSELYNSKISC